MKKILWTLGVALLLGSALDAQLDRGALTGTVSDPTGAVIPNVDVKATNVGTKAVYETTSSQAGSYTLTNLPFGAYEVLFEATSFKKLVRGGVTIGVGEILRLDATLEVGSLTESVEVRSEIQRLQSETSEVGTTLPNQQLFDLPMDWGTGGRSPSTFAWQIVPGTNGGEYGGNVNGAAGFSHESLLDGAPMTTAAGPGVTSFSFPSPEATQEFKVSTAGLSAEYGRTEGGMFNYLLKSGTNAVHGSAFGSLRNEDLDANSFANNATGKPRAPDRQQDYAFSFGGPVYIPKVYNGRNRTFFYVTYERFRERNLGFGAPSITEPIPAFYNGDFSRLLGPTVATDALGNPVAQGAIYDPATFSQLPNGQYTGQMFPGNKIPVSRFSKVSQNLNAIAQQYYLPTVLGANGQVALQNNAYFPLNIIPVWDIYQFSAKGDENISDKQKLSFTFSWTYLPRELANPSGTTSLWDASDPQGGPLSDTSEQRQETSLARASHDWIISPRLLNHVTVFFNRFSAPSETVHSNIDGAKALGIANLDTTGYPIITWGAGPLVTLAPVGQTGHAIGSSDSTGFIDSLSFSKGRHFMKVGFDLRRNTTNTTSTPGGSFSFSATATAIPNASFAGNLTGYSFASYLLGIVASAGLTDPVGLGGRNEYYAAFFQDDFKVSKNLTLQLGVRWEFQPPLTEVANRLSSWDPTKIDPLSGLPGAYDFAGSCNVCTGRTYFGTKDYKGFGPRIGFAYRPFEKWVIRGAYGIVYVPDILVTMVALPSGKGNSLAWGGTYSLSAPAATPWVGLVNWDNGFPTNRYVPAALNASWADTNSAAMIDPRYGEQPYIQQWNLNIQRELMKNLVLDVGYVGNKATRLYEGELERINQLPPSVLSQYGTKLGNAVTSAAQAATNGIAYPYPGYSGTVAGALRQYPQILGTGVVTDYGDPLGFSTYNSLQVTVNRQFSHGFTAYGSYVWSKNLANDNTLSQGGNSGPLDYYNRKLEKAPASTDIPQIFKAFVDYELPFGRGKSFGSNAPKFVNAFLGGWSLGGILTYNNGAPLGFGGSSPLSSWNGALNRANVAAGDLKAAGFSSSAFQLLNTSSASDTYLNKSLITNPAPLTLGTGAPRYSIVRGFGTKGENIGLQKNVRFHEKYRYQLRADFLNIFNRHTLGGIDTTPTDLLFGQVTSVGGSRTMELGMRFDF